METEPVWVEVVVPVPKRVNRGDHTGPRHSPKTDKHKRALLAILRDPPADFDGTDKKLGEYLGLSTRQARRVMKKLQADGLINVSLQRQPTNLGGYYTKRTIQVLKGS